MGVSGTVGVVNKNGHNFGEQIVLQDTPVIIDTTNAFYWYTKTHLLSATATDKYGCSMHELGKLYWNLLTRLRERGCRLYIVFEGPRRADENGPKVSKSEFLRQSADSALARLSQGRLGNMDNLPDLAINCLKEIVNELNLERDQIYQAENEVYPVLVQLANRHKAPVLTGHSDFIFHNVPAGFIWIERLRLPNNSKDPIKCTLYSHQRLLQAYNLNENYSDALSCLCVLLRDDFAGEHFQAVNFCLNLQQAGRLALTRNARAIGVKSARLAHVLQNWPKDLESKESVLEKLEQGSNLARVRQDFEAIWQCYHNYRDFNDSELASSARRSGQLSVEQLKEALTRRESSADFLASATLTNFNRTGIEDLATFRSTYSLQDRVKQFLLARFKSASVRLYDRQQYSMTDRRLASDLSQPPPPPQPPPPTQFSSESLYEMFHFDGPKLSKIASHLREQNHIDAIICNELALLLLLASFALRLIPRTNYDNQPGRPKAGDESGEQQRYSRRQTRVRFLTAILNSYVYLLSRSSQGDQSQQDVLAEIRVARKKVEEVANRPPAGLMSLSDQNYATHKHLIESLNSVLHAYKELNSLYDYQGQRLLVNKYYDAVITYKIMARHSNNLLGSLLQLDEELLAELL